MKRKYIIVGIVISFLIISGICYSCAYNDGNASAVLLSSLSEEEKSEEQKKENQNAKELNSGKTNLDSKNSMEVGSDSKGTLAETDRTLETVDLKSSEEETGIYVHICGAVVQPGVYKVETGARIFDLIVISGGLKKEAAGDYINQAQLVADGQRIYIPSQDEVNELSFEEYMEGNQVLKEDTSATNKLVNINTAGAEELMILPGIGQAKANSIIDYRSSKGKFQTIEDLMKIPGIKEGLFEQISSYIIVK